MQFSLKGHALAPENLESVNNAVIFLHGLGSNADDLIQLAPHFAQKVPDAAFVSVNAPQPCDMVPPEQQDKAFQWFSLQNRDPQAIEEGAKQAHPLLKKFIHEVADNYKIKLSRVFLVGFSQGTMMALYTGPRMEESLGGILGYSGALVGGNELLLQPDNINKAPVMLIHGEEDEVVPYMSMEASAISLRQAGFDIQTLARPELGHSIDMEGLQAGVDFVSNWLGPKD